MKLVKYVTAFIFLISNQAFCNDNIYGSWKNEKTGQRIDILDGFKPGRGPVLIVADNGKVSTGSWKKDGSSVTVSFGYTEYNAKIDDENLLLNDNRYVSISGDGETNAINLKDDEANFVAKLQDYKWLYSVNGSQVVFKGTFSEDTGVAEFFEEKEFKSLSSWAVSSGVFKLGSSVIVEARITDKFFVGLSDNDNFVILRTVERAPIKVSTDVKEQREAFFNDFLTGEWITKSYSGSFIHKFRPVFGELAGMKFTTLDDKLSSYSNWEYSPATGALKFGCCNEYIGAMVVNDTLALIEKDGDQVFYNRLKNDNKKRFNLSDVKSTPLNEKSISKISEMVGLQLQNDDYFYLFEFKNDGRTGFVHKFRSEPFTITAETFSSPKLIGQSERLLQVEDFIIFEDGKAFKIDTASSRLRTKSEKEVVKGVEEQEELKKNALETNIIIRILKTDGTSFNVPLPVSDFSDIALMTILGE